ncbi:plasmid partitioning protein RepB C-terminal domain-containing protein [uncultured Rhodoblastus sp.]|uniref:plasmid partitioning protein RepB C-terminal domain-containing protein n=1 Tax=uncultured Rhodoblastus sp. TaxID=543037 RepID=UPI0025D950BE|nr:plasmid partitioning protein RepB C-terminal domain-containing protein [uncultured Rhodoblastus sp.]
MNDQVRAAFEQRVFSLPITSLLPRKQISDSQKGTVKFRRIFRSIAEVGVVEPLIVSRLGKKEEKYLLLDGHLRLAALQELGESNVRCIISQDDEAFTYNKRVNRLATIQEHFMILRALKSGVSAEKLAKALDLDIQMIKRRSILLNGICPEVVEMLKDKTINKHTFSVLRKMKPLRQIEAAELMGTAANWSASYAKALLAATKQDDLTRSDRPKKIAGMTREQMARMEREMASLHQDFKQIENSYGDDILHLVIASGYLGKLVANKEIERFLSQHHAEILDEFRSIIAATSLDQTGLAA